MSDHDEQLPDDPAEVSPETLSQPGAAERLAHEYQERDQLQSLKAWWLRQQQSRHS